MVEKEIGTVTHYFNRIGVAAITITQENLHVGDTIHFKGHTSDFMQMVDSIQLDHNSINEANVGQSVGLRVNGHTREHDHVYKVVG
jgi:hypothetical protein